MQLRQIIDLYCETQIKYTSTLVSRCNFYELEYILFTKCKTQGKSSIRFVVSFCPSVCLSVWNNSLHYVLHKRMLISHRWRDKCKKHGRGRRNSWRSKYNMAAPHKRYLRSKNKNKSSGATDLQGLGRQSGRRRSAKLVPTFAHREVSRGQRNGSPRPLISVYRTWIATYFIQVAPQLTSRGSRGWVHPVPDPRPLRKSGSAGNRTRDLCICSQKLWPLDHRGGRKSN